MQSISDLSVRVVGMSSTVAGSGSTYTSTDADSPRTNTSTNAAPGTKASTDGASGGTKAGYKYRRLLFCLVYFHAVLVERKKFGTLGYNVPYDFNESDFAVSTYSPFPKHYHAWGQRLARFENRNQMHNTTF